MAVCTFMGLITVRTLLEPKHGGFLSISQGSGTVTNSMGLCTLELFASDMPDQ